MDDFGNSSKIEFPVIGMACGGCAKKVKTRLEASPGVVSADVSHEAALAKVVYDPHQTGEAALKAVVTALDYKVEKPMPETVDIKVYGMTCGHCSGKVHAELMQVPGVVSADVSHSENVAKVVFDPGITSMDALKDAIIHSGYRLEKEAVAAEKAESIPEIRFSDDFEMNITGMTCASCAGRVETALRALDGIGEANVNLALETATISFDPAKTDTKALVKAVEDAGYGVRLKAGVGAEDRAGEQAELKRQRGALILSALLTAPLLLEMGLHMLGFGFYLAPWVQLALATPVQFLIGARFYKGAWHALRAKAGNMDMLVAIGTSAAYFYSLWLVLKLGHGAHGQLYFEASAVVITLILAGKYMESAAKRSASSALRHLLGLRPDSATILTDAGEVITPIEQVQPGDIALLRPGGRVPVDGLIVEGESELDEALITGESMPVLRRTGEEVIAGAINGGGVLKIKTTRVGQDTTLAKVAGMVAAAQVGKAPIQKLVDRISAIFVPLIIVIALLTFGAWLIMGASFESAIVAMISVLVIACPCALGLATPTALVAGTGAAAKAGILIRDIETLERAKSISTVVFDKTGTLTAGKPVVEEIVPFEGDEASLLALAAAVQAGSEHPLGKATVAEAIARGLDLPAHAAAKATAGEGIEMELDGEIIRMGRARFAVKRPDAEQEQQALDLRTGGRTVVWLSKAGKAMGLLAYADPVRPEAKTAVSALHQRGIKAILMTGDNAETAAKVAAELGIDTVIADMRPEDKAREVKALQAKGEQVAMVGDGVNDTPALAQASLGIAMGGGADVAIETAGFVLMRNDPRLVASALDVSLKTAQKIKQNLFWAFGYNVIGIPIAALGTLNPAVAGAAMALSSVFVVSNSLLLKQWKPEEIG